MALDSVEARSPGKGSGLENERLSGLVVGATVPRGAVRCPVRALAGLPRRDRERLLDRLAELRAMGRIMRERGTLAEPVIR